MNRVKIVSLTVSLVVVLLPRPAPAWSGEAWTNITRATIKALADEMIDSTWVPKNTFTNFQYGTTYRTYYQGVTYTGVAYSQNNPQENWPEFLNAVTTTSGGTVGYGNDCSGFVSICWKLPARKTTALFESQLGTYWFSLGDIGSAATAPLIMGDALNSASDHIVLFLNRESTGVRTMEQTPHNAQRRVRTYSFLQTYRPIRRFQILEDRGIALSGNLAFGGVMVGTSAQRTLTIHSTGISALTVSNLSLPAGFSGNWAGIIPAGGSQPVTITFTPTAVTNYSGTLVVQSDATVGTNTMTLSGTGLSAAPQIAAQPLSHTLIAGQSVMLAVTATGLEPLRYQWQFHGTNLTGATTSRLVLNNVTANHAGPYCVVVTNGYGRVTSQVATLTVMPAFQVGGGSMLWRLAPGDRPYLTTNSLPYERGLAYNPVTRRLLLVSRNGPRLYVLDADTGADLHELSVSGVSGGTYSLLMVGVADDGVVYAGNLTTAGTTTPFKLYRWANDNPGPAPTVAYAGDPGGGNNQRWGDTLDVRGAGTNTQVILASRSGNVVAVLTTTDGTNFAARLVPVADAPAGAFGLGLAFGASNTFWGKATSHNLRQVAFNLTAGTGTTLRNHPSPGFPATVAPIGVSVPLNLLGGINVGVTGNNFRLYDLTPSNAPPVFLASTNFASDNDNTGTGTGAVDFGEDRVYALGANNGLMAMRLVPAAMPPQPGRFELIQRWAGGAIHLTMRGTPGAGYCLEFTGDWSAWTPICSLTAATNGLFQYTDSTATNAPHRFYRLRGAP